MNRADAYRVLTERLEQFRAFGYDALLPLVGEAAVTETVSVGGESVVVDVRVVWNDDRHRNLAVLATASGPSTWSMERHDEKLIIPPIVASQGERPRAARNDGKGPSR